MLDSEGIAGKRLLKFESVVELLKEEKEKGNLFADFPIGTTIQDGGKRKRSDDYSLTCLTRKNSRNYWKDKNRITKSI